MNIKRICIYGLLIALVCVATMIVRIPIPATSGYVNVGDSVIMVISALLGMPFGMVAGGVGSALADILVGYVNYAPVTLVVKGLEGFVISFIASKSVKFFSFYKLFGAILGVLIMVLGYFVCEIFMYRYGAAVGSVLPNLFQAIVSFIIYIILGSALDKVKIQNLI